MTNNDDYDSSISLDKIGLTVRNAYYNYNIIRKSCENSLNNTIYHKMGSNYKCYIYDIDCDKSIIKICFCDDGKTYKKVTLKIIDNRVTIFKSNSDCASKLVYYIGNQLLTGYNMLSNYSAMLNQSITDVNDIYGNNKITINRSGITVDSVDGNYSIRYDISNSSFSYSCKTKEALTMINGHEEEIFSQILIKIDDLPQWLQPIAIKKLEIENQDKENVAVKLARKRINVFKKDKI